MSRENMSADEEYQYPQDEYVVEPEESVAEVNDDEEESIDHQKPESPLKQFLMKNKRKVAAGGIAVLLLIIFQIITHSNDKKIIAPVAKPAPVKQAAPQSVAKKTFTSVQQDSRLVKSLQTIQTSGASNAQEIHRLKDELRVLQQQLDDANQTNQQLKQAMVLLLQEVKKVNDQLKKTPKVATKAPLKSAPKTDYFVRAMINGRAWLLSSKGLSRSVIVGDSIPGFGTVSQIDANRGVVLTSTGKVITYGSNDS